MNQTASISFVAQNLEELEKALALFKAFSVPCNASVGQSAIPTLPAALKPAKGPYETQWETYSGKGIRFTEERQAEYGNRENYCYARLVEAGQIKMEIRQESTAPDAEFSAEEETAPPVVNEDDVKDLH